METDSLFLLAMLALTWILSSIFAMAGVGSANTLVPIYYSFGIPFSIAAAAGLLLNVFSLSSATVNNARHRHINWRVGTLFMIPAVIAAPFGAMIGVSTPRSILLIIFSIFLSYTLFNLVRARRSVQKRLLTGTGGVILAISIGGIAGFTGGLLGVGGGMIILPVMTFLESDYKTVSGTAGYVALFSSASGFISYLTILRGVDYTLWLVILIGGIAGGLIGSHAINRYNSQTIRYIIIAVVAAVTAKLLYSIITQYV